jgi:nitrogen regulatory protein PII
MLTLVVMTVDNADLCPFILDAWESLGVRGITILESSGLGRVRRAVLRDDLPLMPSLSDLLEGDEVHHRTIFSVVDDEDLVERMIESAQGFTGNLEEAHTGFLFTVPVSRAIGLGKHRPQGT